MQLINPYFGTTLLETIEQALARNQGDRFDVGVGYARNFTNATFQRFGVALDSWLSGDETRRFRLFIGDRRHWNDSPEEKNAKIKACTEVAANLIKFGRSIEEQMEVVFLRNLHAKFYAMWSQTAVADRLEWTIIGSSNLTDAAFQEKNIELDVYVESSDLQLQTIQIMLSEVIRQAYSDGDSWGDLHHAIQDLTAKARWETEKMRTSEASDAEIEAELQCEERREAEERAQRESDQRQGIIGSE